MNKALIIILSLSTVVQLIKSSEDLNSKKKSMNSAITYEVKKGARFGDMILVYAAARYLAYKNDVPLLYKSFPYSEKLLIHQKETRYSHKTRRKYRKIIKTGRLSDPNFKLVDKILYEMPYNFRHWTFIRDKNFMSDLRKLVLPIDEMQFDPLPLGRACVALHVRKGGGYDLPLLSRGQGVQKVRRVKYADKCWPLKFPPDSFYISQIRWLSNFLNNAPLYVHIFTDDKNPEGLIRGYKEELNDLNIVWGCRKENNHHNKNVLYDYFYMTKFDYLIRGQSSFSATAEMLGNFKIVIIPKKIHWEKNSLIVDEVVIKNNTESLPLP